MLGKTTLRAKILIGIALACAGYVIMMPDTSQTIEPTRSSGTDRHASAAYAARAGREASAGREAPVGGKLPLLKTSFRSSDRIVNGAAAAALFSAQSWYVAPPPPPPPPPAAVQAPPAPTAPPLPFVFMGSYLADGAVPTYFLTSGDRVYDVKIGDTLDNLYSVDGVRAGQLLLTYLPLKIQQSLAVGGER